MNRNGRFLTLRWACGSRYAQNDETCGSCYAQNDPLRFRAILSGTRHSKRSPSF